jgi:hypothetical protein
VSGSNDNLNPKKGAANAPNKQDEQTANLLYQ